MKQFNAFKLSLVPPKLAGAYTITHLKTQRVYVGSTSNLYSRKSYHEEKLRKGIHWNENLQAAYNDDPEIEFSVWITDTVEEAREIEQGILDHHYSDGTLFNIALDAQSPMKGRKHKESSIEKIRLGAIGRTHTEGTKEALSKALTGREFTEEHRENIRLSKTTDESLKKLTGNRFAAKKVSIRDVVYDSLTDASKALGIGVSGIQKRCASSRHPLWFYV